MILVYVNEITPRISYTFDLVLAQLCGYKYLLTADLEHYSNHDGPKFSYASHPIDDGLFFRAARLLYSKGLSDQAPDLDVFTWNDMPAFYKVLGVSAMPFDAFSAS